MAGPLGRAACEARVGVGGTVIKTTLDTLLAEPSSLLYLMFEPMVQGAEPVNAAAARSGAGGLMEAVPHQYGGHAALRRLHLLR